LAALALAMLAVWLPDHQYGDGRRYLGMFSAWGFGPEPMRHWAYIPTAVLGERALEGLGIAWSPGLYLQLFSAACCAIGLGATWLLARALGCTRRSSWCGVALFGLAPGVMFFGRVVEVAAFQFAVTACVFAAVAIAGRGSLPRALFLTALLGPALFLAHHGGLLLYAGLGALATWVGRAEEGERGPVLTLPSLLLGATAAAIAAGLGLALAAHLYGQSITELADGSGNQIALDQRTSWLGSALENIVLPLAFAWPCVLLGARSLARRSEVRGLLFVLLAGSLPALVFFTWWAVPERGAYLFGVLPLLGVLGAHGIESLLGARVRLLPALGIAQLVLGTWTLAAWEAAGETARHQARFDVLERALEDVPGPKYLLTVDPYWQSPSARISNLLETSLANVLRIARDKELPPTVFVERIKATSGVQLLLIPGAVEHLYYDRTSLPALGPEDAFGPYVEQLELGIQQLFEVESLADGAVWRLHSPQR